MLTTALAISAFVLLVVSEVLGMRGGRFSAISQVLLVVCAACLGGAKALLVRDKKASEAPGAKESVVVAAATDAVVVAAVDDAVHAAK